MYNKVKRIASGFLVATVMTTSMGVTAFAGEANTGNNQKNIASPTVATATAQQKDQTFNEKEANIKDFQARINAQSDAPVKANLDQLFTVYQSKVTATENAKKVLVTELSKYDIEISGEVVNIGQVEKVIKNLDNPAAAEKLTRLLTTYKNAIAAEQSAKDALDAELNNADQSKINQNVVNQNKINQNNAKQ